MDPLNVIDPASFFGDGIVKINENFTNLQQQVQALKLTEDYSGIATPVVMTMGSTNQHWLKPAGLVGPFLLFDHGFAIREDQYTETATEIVLNYVPASPYAITIGWNLARAAMTPPVALTQHATLGTRFWVLPDERGLNPWIFYSGRLLKQTEYVIDGNIVELLFNPITFDIAASWGSGGPGMTAPVLLVQQFPLTLDTAHFLVPPGSGPVLIVQDHGLTLDSDDYSVNLNTGIITLNYSAIEPLDVTASWGFPLDGLYLEETILTPLPDGVRTEFILPGDPLPGTLRLRTKLSDGSLVFHVPGDDFEVVGRRVTMTAAPPADSKLLAAMSTVTHFSQLAPENPHLGTTNSSVTVHQGVEINIDTLDKHCVYNLDQTLQSVKWLDGATVIKQIDCTYDVEGRLDTLTEQAGGWTVVHTYIYDVNGNVEDVVKTVST